MPTITKHFSIITQLIPAVFRPDLAFEHDRLRGWAVAVGRVIGGVIRYEDRNGCFYKPLWTKDFRMLFGTAVTACRQFTNHFTTDTLSLEAKLLLEAKQMACQQYRRWLSS
jgi:hypothetical protein